MIRWRTSGGGGVFVIKETRKADVEEKGEDAGESESESQSESGGRRRRKWKQKEAWMKRQLETSIKAIERAGGAT